MLNCRRSFRVFAVRVISAFPVNSSEVRTTSDSAALVSNSHLANSPWITWGKLTRLRLFHISETCPLRNCFRASPSTRHLFDSPCESHWPQQLSETRPAAALRFARDASCSRGNSWFLTNFCSVTIAREFCLLRFGAFLLVLLNTRGNLFILCVTHQPSSLCSNSAASAATMSLLISSRSCFNTPRASPL